MGLLYPFPIAEDETDFVSVARTSSGEVTQVEVKSYGLPYLFWLYAFIVIAMILIMYLAVHAPIEKLASLGDDVDKTLARALQIFLGLLPICILSFFFYEKRLTRLKETIIMQQRLFGIAFFTETFEGVTSNDLEVKTFLDSPNMARMSQSEDSRGFQNKGYFILSLKTKKGDILLDRHSRKHDLLALKQLLSIPGQSVQS